MFWYLISFVAGLIVGWNFLPQPQFIQDFMNKILNKEV